MLFRIKIFLSVFVVAASLSSCAQNNSKVYPIAFYNTENLFDTYNDPLKDDDEFTPDGKNHYSETIYKQRLHHLAYVLSKLGIEQRKEGVVIIGLAEIENSKVLSDLIAQPELKNRNYKYITYNSPDPRGIDVALLYNPARFRLLSSKAIHVPIPEEPTRDVLYVTGIIEKDTFHVLINHWHSRREGKSETAKYRAAASKICVTVIDSLLSANRNARILLMGDLNDNPDDASVRALTAMHNPWMSKYKQSEGTIYYKRHWDLFDQILVSPFFISAKSKWTIKATEIYKPDYLIVREGKFSGQPRRAYGGSRWLNGYSDHLPVILYLGKN
jgi:endonuclease/exonuclease/phosphatase family metal-dependent hydrolase